MKKTVPKFPDKVVISQYHDEVLTNSVTHDFPTEQAADRAYFRALDAISEPVISKPDKGKFKKAQFNPKG